MADYKSDDDSRKVRIVYCDEDGDWLPPSPDKSFEFTAGLMCGFIFSGWVMFACWLFFG